MSNWPCNLEAQDEDLDPVVAPTIVVQGAPSSPAATFSVAEEGVTITYNPRSVSDPASLIATFAHELAHYLTSSFSEEPPGGWDNWEFATDVTSVFLGFGIFAANSVFTFSQHTSVDSHGWRSSRLGYLSEPEIMHALGIFSALNGVTQAEVLDHVKPSLRAMYKRVCKDLAVQSERIDALKTIEGVAVHDAKSA